MESELQCGNCELELKSDDEFCPRCGTIFDETVNCYMHESQSANGVCVICHYAFCNECGSFVNETFLCKEHEHYEILQSLAVVATSKEAYEIESVRNTLMVNGLHPFLFSGRNIPSTYLPSTEYNNQNALDLAIYGNGEIKILVPFSEVLEAENILNSQEEMPGTD
ncbi:MAG: hypothetical protein Q8L04_06645 [Ignavibacteria bacterium]|nr:hypothetical protein [Ignavibacteria bacterium]